MFFLNCVCFLVLLKSFSFSLQVNETVSRDIEGQERGVVVAESQTEATECDDEVEVNSTVKRQSIVSLKELLDIWNPEELSRTWNPETYEAFNVSAECGKDMTEYGRGVLNGELWALKMMDSSGRYSWGFLSGNKLWLGVTDQCKDLRMNFFEWRKKNAVQRGRDVPPFSVAVNSVTLTLQIFQTELKGKYPVQIGLCLPSSCNIKDVDGLVRLSQNNSSCHFPRKFTINDIRNISQTNYKFWTTTSFKIMAVSTVVVIIFVILGTLYDIALRYQVLQARERKRKNSTTVMDMKVFDSDANNDNDITISQLWSVREHNGSLDVQNRNNVPKPLSEALLSFSLLLNVSKVFSLDVGNDTLAPIHGLKFLSMLWVILVHTCLTVNAFADLKTFRSKAEADFLYQTISNGTYAVDTFFFVSGCLVSFLYFRTIDKDTLKNTRITKSYFGQFLQFLGMIWYRYFRLTPLYLVVIGYAQVSARWFRDYTMIDEFTIEYKNCHKVWWRNILYINTYYDLHGRCLTWTWYLANDTQFYIIGIILLIIAASCLPLAAVMTIFFMISAWITTAVITLNTQHVPSIQDPFAHYADLYDKPWSRIGPYLIGMIVGWYLYKTDCKLRINKAVAAVCWTLSAITMTSIVYGIYGNDFGPTLSAMYTSLSHTGWALAIAWILIACVTGNGGIINKILSWKYIFPASRLSYCTYLIHPLIIRHVLQLSQSSIRLTEIFMAVQFFGFTVMSYMIALVLSLLFEAPVVSLLRIVHPLRRWKWSR